MWMLPNKSSRSSENFKFNRKLWCHFLFQSEFKALIEILREFLPEKSDPLRTPIGKIDGLSPTDRECSLKNAEVVPKHICNGKQNCWVYHNLFHRDPCPEQVKYAVVHYKCTWHFEDWKIVLIYNILTLLQRCF